MAGDKTLRLFYARSYNQPPCSLIIIRVRAARHTKEGLPMKSNFGILPRFKIFD